MLALTCRPLLCYFALGSNELLFASGQILFVPGRTGPFVLRVADAMPLRRQLMLHTQRFVMRFGDLLFVDSDVNLVVVVVVDFARSPAVVRLRDSVVAQ